jgi:hypothetical protein
VKYLLTASARPWPGQDPSAVGAGLVDAYAALTTAVGNPANRGLRPSDSFARSILPLVKGQVLTWSDPNYLGTNWTNITWDNITWDNITWDNITWDNITWDNITWDTSSRPAPGASPWPSGPVD